MFILGEKNKQDAITIGCKTAEIKAKWIEAIRLAQYVVLLELSTIQLPNQIVSNQIKCLFNYRLVVLCFS